LFLGPQNRDGFLVRHKNNRIYFRNVDQTISGPSANQNLNARHIAESLSIA